MKRRNNGEGCVYQDARGNYVARMQIGFNDNGKPKIKSFSGKTAKEAITRMNKFKNQQDKNIDVYNSQTYIEELIMLWLENKKKLQLKPTSYDRLKSTITTHIIPAIGNLLLEDINCDIIQKYLIQPLIDNNLSLSSIKKVYQALNNFFEQMITEEKLMKNPLRGVVLPQSSRVHKNIRTLTKDEIDRFVHFATAKCISVDKPVYRLGYYYVFMLYTGIRCGEALALQWKHIDLDGGVMKIEQNLVLARNNDGKLSMQLQSTKTKSGIRKVFLCAKAKKYFELHKNLYYTGNNEDFVAVSETSKWLRTRNFERGINYIFKAADIDASGVHILRHTYASLLFEKGCDVKYISQQIGHSNTSVTMDCYVHLMSKKVNRYQEIIDTL